ncbi:hypothetical protein D4764_14G0000690, partial [Takifugu flavidus]
MKLEQAMQAVTDGKRLTYQWIQQRWTRRDPSKKTREKEKWLKQGQNHRGYISVCGSVITRYLLTPAPVPKPPDWTVLIAVVVSIGGLALLLLLIFGIIFCYKRRIGKQTTYQDEIKRRARSHSQRTDASGQQDGKENQGYVSDDHTSSGPWDRSDSGVTQAKGSGIFE